MKRELYLLTLLAAVSFGSAFLVAPHDRHHHRPLEVSQRKLPKVRFREEMTNTDEEPNHSIILGSSPKAVRLRKNLQEVWSSPKTAPILIIGPRGSGKGEIAEEILDRLPTAQKEAIHRLSLHDAVSYVDTILGSTSQPGLLDLLSPQRNTTVVLTGFTSRTAESSDELERRKELYSTLVKLIKQETFYSRHEGKDKHFEPRIIVILTEQPEFLDESDDVFLVKVPALESRTQDMEAISNAKIKIFEKQYNLENVHLSREATHRLLDHRWEVCESELDAELCNALELLASEKQQDPKESNLLKSKHMLVNSHNESMRRRLLYDFPVLRKLINSPWVFDHTLRYIVTPAFVLTLAALFLGPQTRDHNTALTYFWGGWWPIVMLSYPFLGRIWCSICPFMAVGNLAQETVTSWGVELKKWPKWASTIGFPFSFGLFAAILMWEELWDLPQNGTLSAYLLLLITSGAVFNSVQYEKRMWCRYLCPIGAMCRTFGTMSMLEVRSWKANCEGCTNPQCLKGSSPAVDPTDTFALKGCTMNLKNNQLRDMGDCTLCMGCIKSCEREVPELNSRPVGIDYGLPWLLPPVLQKPENLSISQVETNYWLGALLTVLQGSVLVHYMPKLLADVGMDPAIASATPAMNAPFFAHSVITAVLLALPGLLSLTVDSMSVPIESAVESFRSRWEKKTGSTERQVVIALYETILEADKPLEETLRDFDPDQDGRITCWECKQALSHLNLPENQCETLMGLMKKRFGDVKTLAIDAWLEYFQELYLNARRADFEPSEMRKQETRMQDLGNELLSKKTFVEIFNEWDKDGDGFITEEDFSAMLDQSKFKHPLTDEEKHELFGSADRTGTGALNLFEFMSMMRKIVRVGIQEIGYGYLPLAWASLTAYWLGVGMKELGLSLARLPDTFYMEQSMNLPQIAASTETVQAVQTVLLVGAVPISIGLTQKLCNDNNISAVRFGLHAAIQVIGAAVTLYLMLSSSPAVA